MTAFSRERPGHKVCVQDRIQQHSEEVCDLLMAGDTSIYICGSATMARDVTARLGERLKTRNGWSNDELRAWADVQKKSNKWQEDVCG